MPSKAGSYGQMLQNEFEQAPAAAAAAASAAAAATGQVPEACRKRAFPAGEAQSARARSFAAA